VLTRLLRLLTGRPKCTAPDVGIQVLGADTRIGVDSHAKYPHHGTCGRCWTAWPLAPYHVTRCDGPGMGGMFPLCELCWQELATPAARLPHYRVLWNHWMFNGSDKPPEAWDRIEAAVMAGG
jgi:hypothetical protein